MLLRILLIALLMLGFTAPAGAVSVEEVGTAIEEAEQLRAAEFAPNHYREAKKNLELARTETDSKKALQLLDAAKLHADQASEAAQHFSEQFSELVEVRDRLQLTDAQYVRSDLAERSEKEFGQVIQRAEEGNSKKGKQEEKIALVTFRAAQTVAGREQFERPISKGIAEARKTNARHYAPKALEAALNTQRDIEQLIKEDPDAQTRADALSKQGQEQARQAIRVSKMGTAFSKEPSLLESWINDQDKRISAIGDILGVQLTNAQTPEEQLALLRLAMQDMKSIHAQQLGDADAKIRELAQKLAEYQGAMSQMEGTMSQMENDLADMAEVRRKLQLKREAEAKIKRLAGLFDPAMVEILLTTDADVILRMKALNFRSGSAVIPPASFELLDNVMKSIEIFPDRSIRVEGHTDFIGNNDYNQDLSERRAKAVGEYISQRLPEASGQAVIPVGHGEEKPIANNETAEGRTKNRRIDIVLVAPPYIPE